ncbi:TolC family protein [Azohydromonas lata]|uniref:TolC family protein n=1 Tax=Azohydromonas lata TaxID=45677 RepID=A0ABU5IP24_9BURK|nr:TolC family protein [Azohydromonas lata]MDZ5460661.1 TolC family protein [Azohydromonas lata]
MSRNPVLLLLLAGPALSALACPALAPQAAAALTPAAVAERVPLCHPDVLAAERALGGAAADVVTAGQRPNPTLGLGAGNLGRNMGAGSLWNKAFDHQVRVDQLVERGGKPRLRVATAQAQRDAATADVFEARRQATAATLRTFHDLAAALARREELAASVALNDSSLQAFEQRVKSGDAAPLDATRFRLDALRVQADLVQADTDARTLRQQLALALGAPEQAQAIVPRAQAPAQPAAPQPVPLERLPAVAAAQSRLAAAQQALALALARAQATRDVGVGVQLDRYPVTSTNSSGTGNTVSVFVSVPLLFNHAYEGEIGRAQADVDSAAQALERARAEAQDEATRALAQWQAAQSRRRLVSDELLPAAQRVAQGAELSYQRGASGVLDVLDARRSLRAAQIERINAEAEAAKALVDLQAVSQAAAMANGSVLP